ncbi:MAG TPA: 4-hydroxy-tetrahydrodipicolinate synthase [Lentisphaeria bacterium]|nr:MAG: 4-hydroxy-tetrahydrodipicolinate synthase [Lentisphaerae bacterium GWF2_50_93]HCE45006.1 4-hydroxy-tetrahydrodipicolinate synthase [Lentisphaeria bacterium]
MELKGVYTALVTPFSSGKVDFKKLAQLVDMQIKAGVDGIVPVGTTGESPTLSFEEHIMVIEKTIEAANGRCRIIAGTGANSTDEAIYLTNEAKAAGADATLQVTPYYNKPTPEGLYRHFSAIADKCGLPVVLYNVPGRCGIAIPIETIARLSKNKNIIAVKEAGGSVERVSAILDVCDITVLSGDDSLTIPMMSVGAKGIISVVSNLIPAELKKMVDAFAAGDTVKARKLHMKYFPLFRDMFVEANPIPIKTAMAIKGIIKEEFRLPMCPIGARNREVVIAAMKKSGV